MFLVFTLAVMVVPLFLRGSYFMNVLVFIGINLLSVYGGVLGWYRVYPQIFSLTTSL